MSIVVIDDTSTARDDLAHLLTRNGFVVHPALVCQMSGDAASGERILFTGQGALARSVQAHPTPRCEYLDISLTGDRILRSVTGARGASLRPPDGETPDADPAHQFIAGSPRMRRLAESIQRVAQSDSSVLITGESGTGKEVVAREISRLGRGRRRGGLVPVNCGAIADSLVDSELFGHKKGAFTDATSDRKGLIEIADGGVLFLDEIGEMPLAAQTKLLRFLDSGEFRRVGDSEVRRADVRVLTATNRNLEHAIARGEFRLDLFYRLCVVALHIPPLRERRSDIRAIAEQHLRRIRLRLRTNVHDFSEAAMALLEEAPWPGNVRELQNVVERVVVLAAGDMVTAEDVRLALSRDREDTAFDARLHGPESPLPMPAAVPPLAASVPAALARAQAEMSPRELRGSQAQVAASLGISRTTLWRRRRRLEQQG